MPWNPPQSRPGSPCGRGSLTPAPRAGTRAAPAPPVGGRPGCDARRAARCLPLGLLTPPENPIVCHASSSNNRTYASACCEGDFCNRLLSPQLYVLARTGGWLRGPAAGRDADGAPRRAALCCTRAAETNIPRHFGIFRHLSRVLAFRALSQNRVPFFIFDSVLFLIPFFSKYFSPN